MSRTVSLEIKLNKNNLPLYIMLVPFFFPRGFGEYFSFYHTLYVALLSITSICIFLMLIYEILQGKTVIKTSTIMILLYHLVLLIITICMQSGITEGLQKIFLTPALCILCINQIKMNSKRFLDILSNILIVDLLFNVMIFNQWVFPKYFMVSNHITFIGHVQIIAQIGLISLLVGYILKNNYAKRKGILLMVLAIINMLYSDTLVSYISIIIFFIGIIIINKFNGGKIVNHPYKFFIGIFLISLLLIYITRIMNGYFFWQNINISINGRMFIWNDAFEKMKGHWLFGYGAYGVLLQVFWNAWSGNVNGFNYAHSEILQLLLDGGILLLVIYIFMIVSCLKEMDKAKNRKDKRVVVLLFGIFMVISIVESITEYYYFFAFLCIILCFAIIQNDSDINAMTCYTK